MGISDKCNQNLFTIVIEEQKINTIKQLLHKEEEPNENKIPSYCKRDYYKK